MGDEDKYGKEMCSSGFSRALPDYKDQVDRREVMIVQPMMRRRIHRVLSPWFLGLP
jgi:hypothetical protein